MVGSTPPSTTRKHSLSRYLASVSTARSRECGALGDQLGEEGRGSGRHLRGLDDCAVARGNGADQGREAQHDGEIPRLSRGTCEWRCKEIPWSHANDKHDAQRHVLDVARREALHLEPGGGHLLH